MRKSVRFRKALTIVVSQLFLAGFGGACLPDNVLADTGGQIVNGLILAGVNMVLNGSDIQI